MKRAAPPHSPLAWVLSLALLASATGAACRFLPNRPYWIEAQGHGQGVRLAAWPNGAAIVGTDRRLWGYPGAWSQPWMLQGPPQELRALAASQVAVYGIQGDGQVARWAGAAWVPYAGSASWGASEVAATEDDRLLVIVGGHVRLVEGADLKETGCGSLSVVAVASARAGEVYVLDGGGALHHGQGAVCEPIATPTPLSRIAATTGRLVGVGADGSMWRRRTGGAWEPLPAPRKFRPGRLAYETRGSDAGVSTNTTWMLDNEGAVFVLSDET